MCIWISQYLTNRKACVQNKRDFGRKKALKGVPQGEALSFTLFMLFMNDVANLSNLQSSHSRTESSSSDNYSHAVPEQNTNLRADMETTKRIIMEITDRQVRYYEQY